MQYKQCFAIFIISSAFLFFLPAAEHPKISEEEHTYYQRFNDFIQSDYTLHANEIEKITELGKLGMSETLYRGILQGFITIDVWSEKNISRSVPSPKLYYRYRLSYQSASVASGLACSSHAQQLFEHMQKKCAENKK